MVKLRMENVYIVTPKWAVEAMKEHMVIATNDQMIRSST